MEKYTIQTAIPTGKTHQMYGTEFHVKFAENEGTFKLWYKEPPQEGKEQYGTIDGWKFKKASKQDLENAGIQSASTPSATPAAARAPYSKPAYKDNSDGMRKGMAINNAAAYVLAVSPEPLSPNEWATAVTKYATALYLISELDGTTLPKPEDKTIQNVKDVFGITDGQN